MVDDSAIQRARIARAFGDLLGAGMANLNLLYAARIAAASLCARGDREAALAALRHERDAAIEALRMSVELGRERAIVDIRRARRPRRFRVAAVPLLSARKPEPKPRRPPIGRPPAAAPKPWRQLRP